MPREGAKIVSEHPMYPGIDWRDCTKIGVVDGDVWDFPFWNNAAHGSLVMFQGWLVEQCAKIPGEFAHAADIEIDSEGGYEGEHHARITISYWRPMTAAEIKDRDAEEKRSRDRSRAHLESEYARLGAVLGKR